MFCRLCGVKIKEGSKNCSSCGELASTTTEIQKKEQKVGWNTQLIISLLLSVTIIILFLMDWLTVWSWGTYKGITVYKFLGGLPDIWREGLANGDSKSILFFIILVIQFLIPILNGIYILKTIVSNFEYEKIFGQKISAICAGISLIFIFSIRLLFNVDGFYFFETIKFFALIKYCFFK
jgi:hypothetical protein